MQFLCQIQPIILVFIFSLQIQKRKTRYKQGNSFPYVFSLGAKCTKIFQFLLSTNILFTVLKRYNVILCQLFFQQTGAVKTLPQHNPLILSFFTDSNEFLI